MINIYTPTMPWWGYKRIWFGVRACGHTSTASKTPRTEGKIVQITDTTVTEVQIVSRPGVVLTLDALEADALGIALSASRYSPMLSATEQQRVNNIYNALNKNGIRDRVGEQPVVGPVALTDKARQSPEVVAEMRQGRKIGAIKALRAAVPGTSLIEAKNAVDEVYAEFYNPPF